MKCPVCNKIMNGTIVCDNCGYDLSVDYEQFATLMPLKSAQIPSIAAYKKRRQQRHWLDMDLSLEERFEYLIYYAIKEEAEAQLMLSASYASGQFFPQNDSRALYWLTKAAEQNCAEAQYKLATWYAEGSHTQSNMEEAIKWYDAAMTSGSVDAALALAECYLNGKGVPEDPVRATGIYTKIAEQGNLAAIKKMCQLEKDAMKWTEMAAERGDVESQIRLGDVLIQRDHDDDQSRAVSWYKKAAEQGDKLAYMKLGKIYYERAHFGDSFQCYQFAATAGEPESQYALGLHYQYGQAVDENPEQAYSWVRKAAENGCEAARIRVAEYHETGYGVKKDLEEAVKWYEPLAQEGDRNAQTRLAACCAILSEEQNSRQKVDWLKLAASYGNENATLKLAVCYHRGDGIPADQNKAIDLLTKLPDNAEALYWRAMCYEALRCGGSVKAVEDFEKSANMGYAEAQYALGLRYFNGHGVSRNAEEASKWFEKAVEQGHAEAMYKLALCGNKNIDPKKLLQEASRMGHADAARELRIRFSLFGGRGEIIV